jgi:uncharacterized membrane protein YphA (DoxX/SURF4 family)
MERQKTQMIQWTGTAMLALVVLRTMIGWHFLYEGLVKLANPNWTSAPYLKSTEWMLSGCFHAVAGNEQVLRAADLMNMWGLTLIGLGLMLGCFSRLASLFGALVLVLYYVAHPPLAGLGFGLPVEGSYLLIDKNVVELAALLALACVPTGRFIGLDGLLRAFRGVPTPAESTVLAAGAPPDAAVPVSSVGRREMLKHLLPIPAMGAFAYAFQERRGWESLEAEHLLSHMKAKKVDAVSGASAKRVDVAELSELKGPMPRAKIGNLELSRIFLGGNLIGGWAHSRDLMYVSDLVCAYHTDRKVFETLHLGECCGMNTILTSPRLCRVITDYWKKEGGKIQFISDCAMGGIMQGAKVSIDAGAHACYAQGGVTDRLVAEGDFDTIEKFLELARRNGIPAGIGAHKLETVQGCVDKGFKPDFWVKTLHHTDYWSAKAQPEQDNIWCVNPKETIAYMETLEQPWIGFKTLAAGAIHPKVGFPYALKNGADFICVGMYDFQVVKNANLFLEVWDHVQKDPDGRKRPWRA